MQRTKHEKIRPVALLYELRMAVSEILNKRFTERIDHKAFRPDQKVLAIWAEDCAKRVLPYFEESYPNDERPRNAIYALHEWVRTGKFSMAVIRNASLSAHAAAKGKHHADAVFAAHAAGQAVGTAHVATHSFGSSIYAIRAVAAHTGNIEDGLIKERNWQLKRLRHLVKKMRTGS